MPPFVQPHPTPYVWVAVAVAIGLRFFLRARPKPLQIERMWVMPCLVAGGVAVSILLQPPPSLFLFAAEAVALAVGAVLGWWRGAATRLTIDPETHQVTSQTSVLGLALVAGVVLLRVALRDYAFSHAADWKVTPLEIFDISLLFAAGLVCVQQLEMWLRARRLLADARGEP